MKKIYILGVGPGSKAYVLPRTEELACHCDILIGGTRNLALFEHLDKEMIEIKKEIPQIIDYMKSQRENKTIGVLVSGDPGFFSMLHTMKRFFTEDDLEVFPGISSIQYLFSRIAIPWDDARIISLHGRQQEEWVECVRKSPKVGLFTDTKNSPALICNQLLAAGVSNKRVFVGENLSYPEERIYKGNLQEMSTLQTKDMNVMVIIDG